MSHVVHIQNREQYIKALGVLDKLPGMWHARGTAAAPVLLLLDSHYNALVEAGVVPANDKEVKDRGKKASRKKNKS